MELLTNWDTALFYTINHFRHPILDVFFLWITQFHTLQYCTLILLAAFFSRRPDRWKIALCCVALISFSEYANDEWLKPLFHRARPCHVLENTVLLYDYCPKSFSFPSGHATNIFALAIFLVFYYPQFSGLLGMLTVLISLSRIYVGVHYPSDVLGGAIVGTISALIWLRVTRSWMLP